MRTLVLALLALGVSAPVHATKAHPATPKSDPGTWVQTDDYPASALRENFEGVVHFTLTVDATGHPTDCKVTSSSGHSDLDDVACARLLERGEFNAATDNKGRPVEGTWADSVRWQIPDDDKMMDLTPGYLIVDFLVDTDGSVSDCRVERTEGSLTVPNDQGCPPDRKVKPILDANGKPVRKRVRMTLGIEEEDVPSH